MDVGPILPSHGGYQGLEAFRLAEIVFDANEVFCRRAISPRSRTNDQMVQAARSGKQNIAEGSMASGTSKKMEIKLIGVARASLEELKLDYEDFLRGQGLQNGIKTMKKPSTSESLPTKKISPIRPIRPLSKTNP